MFNQEWSAIHGGTEIRGITKFWLKLSPILAKPFISLRISPNIVTTLSLFSALPLIFAPKMWIWVLVSLILDGLDGTIAILSKKITKFGAALDSIADRAVEFIWIVALYKNGVNLIVLGFFLGGAWLQEYLRARAGGLGIRNISVVTISERPVRAIFILMAIIFFRFSGPILSAATVVQLLALMQLFRAYKMEFKAN